MGASYMAIWFWRKPGPIDWDAAERAAQELTADDLMELTWLPWGENVGISNVVDKLAELRQYIDEDELAIIRTPDDTWEVWTVGGESYGDWPNDAYGVLDNLREVPSVLNALGIVNV